MKIWKVMFTIDDGYDRNTYIYIMIGNTESEVKEKFMKWIQPLLIGESYIVKDALDITEIHVGESGIIYQNFFRESDGERIHGNIRSEKSN